LGCAVHVSASRFEPSSAVRGKGVVAVESVRYIQAERHSVKPNQFEFNKAGSVYFEIPLADHLRRCIVRELEASGYLVGNGGAKLAVDITRYHLADKFTSLELYIESTWSLTVGEKVVAKKLRAARRHFHYSNSKKADDMNNMATELYEAFFSDPEVKALLAQPSAELSSQRGILIP
jgi:hypothetical protein